MQGLFSGFHRLSCDLETLPMVGFSLNCTPVSCYFYDVYNTPNLIKSGFSSSIHRPILTLFVHNLTNFSSTCIIFFSWQTRVKIAFPIALVNSHYLVIKIGETQAIPYLQGSQEN